MTDSTITAAEALEALRHAMTDQDYADGWHDNLACMAQDEGIDHATANRIAARQMRYCFNATTVAPADR